MLLPQHVSNIWNDFFQATSCRSRRFGWRVRRLFLCLLRRLNWIRRLFLCLFIEWVYSYFLWLLTWVRDGHVLNPQWNVNKLPLHLFRNEVIKLPKLWVNRIFYYFMRKRWRGSLLIESVVLEHVHPFSCKQHIKWEEV